MKHLLCNTFKKIEEHVSIYSFLELNVMLIHFIFHANIDIKQFLLGAKRNIGTTMTLILE